MTTIRNTTANRIRIRSQSYTPYWKEFPVSLRRNTKRTPRTRPKYQQSRKNDQRYENTEGRVPIPIVEVILPSNDTSQEIFEITELLNFEVTVEPKLTPSSVQQCQRCQRFGYGQMSCRIALRGQRCAETHHFSECRKPITLPPRCCNCGGAHHANLRGWPKYPEDNIQPITKPTTNIRRTKISTNNLNGTVTKRTQNQQEATANTNAQTNPMFTVIQQLQNIAATLSTHFSVNVQNTLLNGQ